MPEPTAATADVATATEAAQPATVVGVEQDALVNKRVRKSFGPRSFWGTVVGCYWVGGGLFYKVSFDDGDVDILSADETLQDAKQAGKFSKEDPEQKKNGETAVSYFSEMRQYSLKRKRDEVVDPRLKNVRRVKLWGQRLYATIFTNERNETYIRDLVKTEDGQEGELQATGQARPGDLILAVNDTQVLGMNSLQVSDLIRKSKRPITLAFYQMQRKQQEANTESNSPTSQPQADQTQASFQEPAGPRDSVQAAAATTAAPPTPSTVISQLPTSRQTSQPHQPPQPASVLPSQPLRYAATQRLMNQMLAQERLRQLGYLPPMQHTGGRMPFAVAPNVDQRIAVPSAGYLAGQNPYVQTTTNPAAAQQVMMTSMMRPQAPAPPVPVTNGTQWRRTGVQLSERVQVQSHVSGQANDTYTKEPAPSLQPAVSSEPQTSRFTVISQDEPEEIRESPEPVKTKRWSSAKHLLRYGSAHTDATAIAALAERNPDAARSAMAIAALAEKTPDAARTAMAVDARTHKTQTSRATSFLSPHDFSESVVPSNRVDLTASSVDTTRHTEEDDLGANCIYIKVRRRRLYLTLGQQGSFIAVTSFVPDEEGKPGEVEESGNVFVGDVLVAINGAKLDPNSAPVHVAQLVNAAPRPMMLAFERASWDVLEGIE